MTRLFQFILSLCNLSVSGDFLNHLGDIGVVDNAVKLIGLFTYGKQWNECAGMVGAGPAYKCDAVYSVLGNGGNGFKFLHTFVELTAEESMPRSKKAAATDDATLEVPRKGNKVVNIHATAQLQVVLVKPERFDDASSVADHLNAKRTVVLNLESANKDVARRILDFLSGVAYANDGQIKKVANCTFIITPYNVGLMGDLLDELENNGLYF